ncbi:hypothetical protein D3C77_501510 [compost metagenome]
MAHRHGYRPIHTRIVIRDHQEHRVVPVRRLLCLVEELPQRPIGITHRVVHRRGVAQLDHRVGHAGQEPRRHRFNAAHRARAGGVGAVEHPAVLGQAVDVGREIASAQAAHVLRAQAFLQDDHHIQRLVAPHGGLLFVQAGVARIQRRAGQARLFADDGVHAVHRHLRIHRR